MGGIPQGEAVYLEELHILDDRLKSVLKPLIMLKLRGG